MGLWNDYVVICIKIYNLREVKNLTVFMNVVICIKIYNFKGSKKFDRFYVIDLNVAKVY